MKKKLCIVGMCVICFMLMGCGHEHTWIEATCTEPKTCSECGETEGEALGHTWVEATCTEPKTCSKCGETEGEALGHTWIEANYQQEKTCSVCGVTEGTPLVADFEKYEIPCNVVLDQEFDYDNSCVGDETKDTIMKGLFYDYKCFVSDENHEAKEGYVWQTVTMKITINDYNGWYYGAGPDWSFESYYNMLAYDESLKELDPDGDWYVYQVSENYNGQDYDECLFRYKYDKEWKESEYWIGDFWDESIPRYATLETYFEARVPENSDEMVLVLRNTRLTGEYTDYLFNLNNLDGVEAFRFPKATPN